MCLARRESKYGGHNENGSNTAPTTVFFKFCCEGPLCEPEAAELALILHIIEHRHLHPALQ